VRGKRIPADGIETYPWGGQDPFLTAAPGQALNDNGFLNDDEWFMFTFTGKDLGSTFRYDLLLQRVNGSEVAHVAGDRTDGDGVHGGVFFGGYGKNSSTSKQDRFAEVTIEATCWGASKSPVRVVVD
jgi:hypothetical protein